MRRKGSLPRTKDLTRQPAVGNRQKKQKQYPGCLAHVVSGMLDSVVANRRQPILYKIEGAGGGIASRENKGGGNGVERNIMRRKGVATGRKEEGRESNGTMGSGDTLTCRESGNQIYCGSNWYSECPDLKKIGCYT